MFQENKARQIFRKTNNFYLLIRTHTGACQGVRNARFSENLACFVFLKRPFWDSPFYLITDELLILQCLLLKSLHSLEWYLLYCLGPHSEKKTFLWWCDFTMGLLIVKEEGGLTLASLGGLRHQEGWYLSPLNDPISILSKSNIDVKEYGTSKQAAPNRLFATHQF